MLKYNQGQNGADHSGYPQQISNAIEALANILYLIDANADHPGQVRQLVALADPAMDALKDIVHPRPQRKSDGHGGDGAEF